MLGPNIAQGLNSRSNRIAQFLNGAVLVTADVEIDVGLIEIKLIGLDGVVTMVTVETKAFIPDVSTYHQDDGSAESPQHVVTGLDPQPD